MRKCSICGMWQGPFQPGFIEFKMITAHEFKCFKASPDKVPTEHQAEFEKTLKWERRSTAAFRGVETRRKQGGKRAPRATS